MCATRRYASLGTYAPAGRPVDVRGRLSVMNAVAATPTSVGAGGIMEARNNRGSNIQIPYARVVPMHARCRHKGDNEIPEHLARLPVPMILVYTKHETRIHGSTDSDPRSVQV